MRYNLEGKVVLVTGGASGIGKIMVRKSLEKGALALVIWDYNLAGMEAVKSEFQSFGKQIVTVQMDLARVTEIQAAAVKTLELVSHVDVLINNAGIVVGKHFADHTSEEIERTLQINTSALMHTASAFLPGMLERNSGAICNIASMAGLTAVPKMAVYVASKWAVCGWSESLRLEMKQANKSVFVTTVMPYYIHTGMFDGVKSSIIPILDPEKVTTKIIRGIEKQKPKVAIPLPFWFVRLTQGIFPQAVYDFIMGKVLGVYNTMDDFKGRGN